MEIYYFTETTFNFESARFLLHRFFTFVIARLF